MLAGFTISYMLQLGRKFQGPFVRGQLLAEKVLRTRDRETTEALFDPASPPFGLSVRGLGVAWLTALDAPSSSRQHGGYRAKAAK